MSAQVSSVGGVFALPVPQTVTPCSFAAMRSIEALRMPLVISNRSLGRRANRDAVNGVRSRMITTHSASASASAGSSRCSRSTVTSRPDQSAFCRATPW